MKLFPLSFAIAYGFSRPCLVLSNALCYHSIPLISLSLPGRVRRYSVIQNDVCCSLRVESALDEVGSSDRLGRITLLIEFRWVREVSLSREYATEKAIPLKQEYAGLSSCMYYSIALFIIIIIIIILLVIFISKKNKRLFWFDSANDSRKKGGKLNTFYF